MRELVVQRRFNQRQVDVGQLELPCLGTPYRTSHPSQTLCHIFNLLLHNFLNHLLNLLSVFKLLIELA